MIKVIGMKQPTRYIARTEDFQKYLFSHEKQLTVTVVYDDGYICKNILCGIAYKVEVPMCGGWKVLIKDYETNTEQTIELYLI
jgi:hypothetical protein